MSQQGVPKRIRSNRWWSQDDDKTWHDISPILFRFAEHPVYPPSLSRGVSSAAAATQTEGANRASTLTSGGIVGPHRDGAVIAPADPMPVHRTLVTFNGSANAFATTGNAVMEYELLGFEQSFSQHFGESTFGINIPLVYFGFDLSASVDVGLVQRVEFAPSALGIQYQVEVNDLRAPNGRAVSVDGRIMPFFDNAPVTWDTNYNFRNASLNAAATTAVRAALDLDYRASAAINNFKVGIDLWVDEFGVGPFTIFNATIAGRYSIFETTGGRDTASLGAFGGWLDRATLPGASGGTIGSGDLPSISIERTSDAFARLEFDIAKFIGNLFGIELSATKQIVPGLTFSYVVLSVTVGADVRVGQVITFDPTGIGVDIQTSVGQTVNGTADGFVGEHLIGALGDTFTLATPDMGAGVINVDVNYTLQGTLRSEGQYIATAGINIKALGAELHNTILKDFNIGVGPLINIDLPSGGIPLGSASAYDSSIGVSLSAPEQSFQFYWERPVVGTDGDDNLPLNPQTNAPDGDDPSFVSRGFGGNDIITGNRYNNPIRGDGGNDTVFGGAGLDLLRGDSGNDTIHGGDDIDTIFGETGDDVLYGDEGNDFITGGSLIGGSGSDRLYGGNGNDTLNSTGVDGTDILDGGAGNDRAVIDRSSSFAREVFDMTAPLLTDSTGGFRMLADGTRLYSIERVAFRAGRSDDVIVTRGSGHFVYGGGGNDDLRSVQLSPVLLNEVYFDGEYGDDIVRVGWGTGGTFRGGEGSDRLVVTAADPILVNFTRVFSGEETLPDLTVSGFEHVTVTAGGGQDYIVGSDGDDVLNGNGGDDLLFSGLGADKLYGGAGNDLLVSSTYTLGSLYVLSNGIYRQLGRLESDVLDGGDGEDRARIDRSTRSGGTILTFIPGAATTLDDGTTLINIERIEFLGGSGADNVRGGNLTDTLSGGGGRDVLDGGDGQDIVNAGEGDDLVIARLGELEGDVLRGDAGIDTLLVDLSDRVFGITASLGAAGGLTETGLIDAAGFERFDVTGTSGNDVLTGGNADGDPASTNPRGGNAGDGVPFADRLYGDAGNDTLDGRGGRDFLSGGRGSDTLVWSAGGDLIDGGGDDFSHDANGNPIKIATYIDTLRITFASGDTAAATVVLFDPTIESNILGAVVTNVERLDLVGGGGALFVQGGVAGDSILGSSTGDQLYGVGGDDVIDGRGGVDTIRGGAGNDTITDLSGDGSYYGDIGNDTISAANGRSTLEGGDGDDVLTSGFGISGLVGGAGNDRLFKSLVATLLGSQGSGVDVLAGGDGNDTIVSGYRAIIDGGAGYDVLELTGGNVATTANITTGGTTATAEGGGIAGIERLIFTGGSGDDTVVVGKDFGLLDGGAGINRLTIDFRQAGVGAPVFAATDGTGRTTIGSAGGAFRNFGAVTIYLGNGDDDAVMRTAATLAVYGSGGNDRLGGGTGVDTFYGGDGVDTLVLRGTRAQYTVTARMDGGYTVSDSVANRDFTDTIYGVEFLAFSDTTVTPNRGNVINGTANNDVIIPGQTVAGQPSVTSLDDVIFGNAGNDLLQGGAGIDQLYGGTGDDRYVADSDDVIVEFANQGIDTVESSVTYEIGSNVETLVLTGTGNVNATGNDLFNRLNGNAGNNILDGRAGGDTMIGARGDDTYYVDNALDITSEASAEGYDTVVVFGLLNAWTLRAETEKLVFDGPIGPVTGIGNAAANSITGGFDSDLLYGLAGDDALYGGGGFDLLDGGVGGDYMDGGAGNDTYYVDSIADRIADPSGDFDSVISTSENFTLGTTAIERVELFRIGGVNFNASGNAFVRAIVGNDLANTLTGGSNGTRLEGYGGDDFLFGGIGADVLDGGLGIDRMAGGSGDDTYVVDTNGDLLNEGADGGYDTIVEALSTYVLTAINIERVEMGLGAQTLSAVVGTNLDLIGNDGANVIAGYTGNDVIEGQGGNDQMVGRDGDDSLFGGDGDDRLTGEAGFDYLEGGTGDDVAIYSGNRADYTITFTGEGYFVAANNTNEGTDQLSGVETLRFGDQDVALSAQRQEGGFGPDALLGSAAMDTLQGNDGDDWLRGFAADDVLDAGEGDDLLEGGAGDDRLLGGLGDDSASYALTTAAVRVSLTTVRQNTIGAGFDTLLGIENLTGSAFGDVLTGNNSNNVLTGLVGNDDLRGNDGFDALAGGDGADILRGGRGADLLDGGIGADRMDGGADDDTYRVEDVGDIVTEVADSGDDLVLSTISLRLSANVEGLTLLGTASINGRGNDEDNSLTGNDGENRLDGLFGDDRLLGGAGRDYLLGDSGDDVLDGGVGADRMVGGAGDDTFVVDAADDRVGEEADGGDDLIMSSLTYALSANVERLTLTGTNAINGTGNALANALAGNAGDNTLVGADGNDVISGGAGRDVLTGGAGADIFVFRTGDTAALRAQADRINDFTPGFDKVDLSAIDARESNAADDSFIFIGSAAFGGREGEARFEPFSTGIFIEADTDGDRRADLIIYAPGLTLVTNDDFVF